MKHQVRILGKLGMGWAVFVGVIGTLVGLSYHMPIDFRFLALTGLLFLVSWRCSLLYRLSAASLCLYCGYMIFDGYQSGLWQWTAVWLIMTLVSSTAVNRSWKQLRPGF